MEEVITITEKNLAIRIDEELHRRIKIKLAESDISLKDYITKLITDDLNEDKKADRASLMERFLEYDLRQLFDGWEKNENAKK